jgi:hypothetical protein
MSAAALTAAYGRPFRRTALDDGTLRMLEALRRHYPTLVHRGADGAWWIGVALPGGTAGDACEIASLPGGGWIIGNAAGNGTLDVCRIGGTPGQAEERRVRSFLGLLPEEITGHPDLLPLGQWLTGAAA